jgi:hypothetical protein
MLTLGDLTPTPLDLESCLSLVQIVKWPHEEMSGIFLLIVIWSFPSSKIIILMMDLCLLSKFPHRRKLNKDLDCRDYNSCILRFNLSIVILKFLHTVNIDRNCARGKNDFLQSLLPLPQHTHTHIHTVERM